jgi:lipoprotein-anchoring transpeptidase ErfK/SrfK
MQNPGGVNESQISQSSNTVNSSSKRSPEVSNRYSIDDCKNYDLWSIDTIKAVQAALGVRADGVFGSVSCNAMINKQIETGIAQYGKGYLGNITLKTLGVENPQKASSLEKTVSGQIDIDKVVIDKSEDTLTAYDNGQVVDEVRISHGDDRTYTYYSNGQKLTGRAITRTGTTKVYRTEDADYASKTLGGAPGSMGYARFFNGGLAVHVGNIWSASHGCIRVSLSKMKNLVKMGFGYGDTVVVQE